MALAEAPTVPVGYLAIGGGCATRPVGERRAERMNLGAPELVILLVGLLPSALIRPQVVRHQ